MSEIIHDLQISSLDSLEGLALSRRPAPCPAGVVEAGDPHIMEAVVLARKNGLVAPVLIGKEAAIKAVLADMNEQESDYQIVNAETPQESAMMAAQLVREGKIGMIIKGLIETADLMRAMLKKDTGILKPGSVVSSIALIETPKYHKLFAMTDMGINTFPDIDRKVGIIENAVHLMHRVGVDNPKVAVLSSVEKVNPKQQDTVEADQIKQMNLEGKITGCIIEGPISLDLAVKKEAAVVKGYTSPVAGDADILFVPNILAGNLLIKGIGIFGEMATADIVTGCEVPIVFGSRGGPIDAKYRSIALCALVSEI